MAFKIQDLLPVGLLLVVTTIALSIGANVLSNVQADQVDDVVGCGLNSTGGTSGTLLYTNCSYSYNISNYGLQAQDELGSWMDTLALVVVAAIIIGTLITSFAMR